MNIRRRISRWLNIRGRVRNWRLSVDFWIGHAETVNRCDSCGHRPCDVGHEPDCDRPDLVPDPLWIRALNLTWNYWQHRRALLEVAPPPTTQPADDPRDPWNHSQLRLSYIVDPGDPSDEALRLRLAAGEPISYCIGCGWSAWTPAEAEVGCDCAPF
jgi:hypothetical protein